jgi:hypothetical protein
MSCSIDLITGCAILGEASQMLIAVIIACTLLIIICLGGGMRLAQILVGALVLGGLALLFPNVEMHQLGGIGGAVILAVGGLCSCDAVRSAREGFVV